MSFKNGIGRQTKVFDNSPHIPLRSIVLQDTTHPAQRESKMITEGPKITIIIHGP